MQQAINQAHDLFRQCRNFVLTTHVNPDGDGLGSEVALADWLSLRGKQATIINHNETPSVYRFLDPESRILRYDPDSHADLIRSADVIVVLDTNHPDRLSSMTRAVMESPAKKICVDHHLEPASFADVYVIDSSCTSTGEIVFRMLAADPNAVSITPRMAGALYCAIMTDTGSFRYSNVDPDIHRIVAQLLESGADPTAIYREIYEQWSPGRIFAPAGTSRSTSLQRNSAVADTKTPQARGSKDKRLQNSERRCSLQLQNISHKEP